MMKEEHAEGTDFIYGRWPVKEALQSGPVSKVLVAQGVQGKPIDEILDLARAKKVPFLWVDRRKLDQMAGEHHQGVLAYVSPVKFANLDQLWDEIDTSPTAGPQILFLDGITDPQNLGSILRSAVFFGLKGVVIPKWRAATITGTVVRTSAGAARLIKIAQVTNLANAIETAKKKALWIVGADMDGEDVKKANIPRPFGLVMGSEGEGLHQLIRKKCDLVVSIKGAEGRPGIDSLNVGVATAVLLQQMS